MSTVDHLNFLYTTAESPIQMRIVNDPLLRLARRTAKDITNKIDGEFDPIFEILKRRIWSVFPEIQNNPLSAKENPRLMQLLEEGSTIIKELIPSVGLGIKGLLTSIDEYFAKIKSRENSPLFEGLDLILGEEVDFENYELQPELALDAAVIVSNMRIKVQLISHLERKGIAEGIKVGTPKDFQEELYIANTAIFLGPIFEKETIELVINNSLFGRIICLAHYNFLKEYDGLFESPTKSLKRILVLQNIHHDIDFDDDDETAVLAELNVDFLDLTENSSEQTSDEIVECRVMRFQDGRFVLFPHEDIVEESEYVEVLHSDIHNRSVVSRVRVDSLDSESIILMRAGATSTDSIIPEADRIMGKQASVHRNNQREWKKRLRELIDSKGVDSVNVELRNSGVLRPYARNWSREHLIRPLSDTNFKKLLDYLGFNELESMSIFNSARVIRGAHQRAGSEITRTLKEAFAKVNIETIYELGAYSINLDEDDGVKVVALVLDNLGSSLVKARMSQTRKLMEERI